MTTRTQKDVVISLLAAEGVESEFESVNGSLKIMKEIFLAQQETGKNHFEFRPYRLGPCAFEVHDVLDELEESGLIDVEEDGTGDETFSLTESGQQEVNQANQRLDSRFVQALAREKERINPMDFEEVIEYVYSEYPDMSKNSDVKWMV